jgi:lambda family phage minor tail protein L
MSDQTLPRVIQSPTPGERVTLFRFDTTLAGGGVYYFAQASKEVEGVRFGGVYYTPVDVEFEGFEVNGNGALPTPVMRIANSNEVIQGMVNAYGDMLGCQIQRVRTFRRFLDGEPDADPTAFFGPDTFKIERKVNENPIFIEWELSAAIDQEGKMLPGRQVIRDTCLWRYRFFDPDNPKAASDGFVYHTGTTACPYAGGACFDRNGIPVAADKDVCGRRISDCKLRFGANKPLPFGGFPGVARVRV